MKNTLSIYLVILLSMFIGFTSCEIESERNGRQTEAGKIIYDETINTIRHYIHTLNLAQKIDLYLQSDDEKRISLGFWLLDGYYITEIGKDVQVKGRVNWKIDRKSTDSLHLPSSQWTIYQSSYEVKQAFQITAQTQKNWNILIKNGIRYYSSELSISNAHLQIEMLTNKELEGDIIVNNYSVKMADNTLGTITNNNYYGSGNDVEILTTKYNITQPILFESQEIASDFVDGEILMEVTRSGNNPDQAEPDNITAQISPDCTVSISFRGITEIWNTKNMNIRY